VLEPLTKQDPKNASFLYHLGLAYANTNEKDLARQSLDRALTLDLAPNEAAEARKTLASLK